MGRLGSGGMDTGAPVGRCGPSAAWKTTWTAAPPGRGMGRFHSLPDQEKTRSEMTLVAAACRWTCSVKGWLALLWWIVFGLIKHHPSVTACQWTICRRGCQIAPGGRTACL